MLYASTYLTLTRGGFTSVFVVADRTFANLSLINEFIGIFYFAYPFVRSPPSSQFSTSRGAALIGGLLSLIK